MSLGSSIASGDLILLFVVVVDLCEAQPCLGDPELDSIVS